MHKKTPLDLDLDLATAFVLASHLISRVQPHIDILSRIDRLVLLRPVCFIPARRKTVDGLL